MSPAHYHRLLPVLEWLPAYRRDWLLSDVLAGLALWAVMVPEGMAYAGIVGVPPIMGLYTIVPPLIAYAMLGSSRVLVVGPDTATGLISALTVGALVAQGTAEFNALTSTLAVLIGVFFMLFGALRMGWVAAFIPTPVMRGFIEGLVCVTIIGQVPHLLGISGASGNFFAKAWHLVEHQSDVSLAPMLTGLLSLAAMLLLRHLAPKVPAALIVMVAATILIASLGGNASGVFVVGTLPSGLPHVVLPIFDLAIWQELVPGALAIVLVGYAEALGGAKAAALQSGGGVDPNQELIAHGPANIFSGLFGGFLVVGSLSKTSVAMAAGARTQFANIVAAVFCFLTLVLLTPLFRDMPHSALAAIVIAAMLHLSKPDYLRDLLRRSRPEFLVAIGVIAGELALGVLQGIALGVAISLLLLIYRASHPKGAVLGQLPGTEAYRDVHNHPEAITFPGLLIWRAGGDLFFSSVGHVEEAMTTALMASSAPVKHVLMDASSINFIDTSGCDALLHIIKDLQGRGVSFAFARVRDEVREPMRLGGIESLLGPGNFYERLTDGVLAWQRHRNWLADEMTPKRHRLRNAMQDGTESNSPSAICQTFMPAIGTVEAEKFDTRVPVLIIGAGAAGICAALAAKEAGVEPIVVERDAVPSGSTALSAGLIPAAGTRFQRAKGIKDDPQVFAADIQRKAHGENDPCVIDAVSRGSAPLIEWLADRYGFPFEVIDNFAYPGHSAMRMHGLPSRTGSELINRLRAAAEANDITIMTCSKAEQLFADADGRIRGIRLLRGDNSGETIGCDALVLACNGYGGNPAMVRELIPEMADALYFGHPGNCGDAVIWGKALGAQLSHLGAYQGHGSVATPHNILITWAVITQGGIQVNAHGRRFCDESRGYSEQAAEVLRQPGGLAWDVFDERIAMVARQFEDFRVAERSGALLTADNLEKLAMLMRVPVGALVAELNQVEELKSKAGQDHFGRKFAPEQRCTAPFHAVKVTGALFHTQGGLAIDANARVKRTDGSIFPNLFAAGGAAASVSGETAAGYLSGNGLLTATVLGRAAGRAAARLSELAMTPTI